MKRVADPSSRRCLSRTRRTNEAAVQESDQRLPLAFCFFSPAGNALEPILERLKPDQILCKFSQHSIDALSVEPGLNALMDLWRSDMGPFRKDPRFSQIIEKEAWTPYWDRYGLPASCSRDGDHVVCY